MVGKIIFLYSYLFAVWPLFVIGEKLKWTYKRSQGQQKHWPGTCQTGEAQSPINIETSKVKKIKMHEKPLTLHGYQKILDADVQNNGKTISINIRYPSAVKKIWVQTKHRKCE